MNISDQKIAGFQELCRQDGIKLSSAEARRQAIGLMELVAITRRPLAKPALNADENVYGQT